MKIDEVTPLDLAREVYRIANERPNVVYAPPEPNNCFYDRGQCTDGTVGCLIGQALTAMGVPLGSYPNVVVDELVGPEGVTELDRVVLDWLQSMQSKQDGGTHWGDAAIESNCVYSIEEVLCPPTT